MMYLVGVETPYPGFPFQVIGEANTRKTADLLAAKHVEEFGTYPPVRILLDSSQVHIEEDLERMLLEDPFLSAVFKLGRASA